jgi:hypothetical protein
MSGTGDSILSGEREETVVGEIERLVTAPGDDRSACTFPGSRRVYRIDEPGSEAGPLRADRSDVDGGWRGDSDGEHPVRISPHPCRRPGAHCRPLDPTSLSLLPLEEAPWPRASHTHAIAKTTLTHTRLTT